MDRVARASADLAADVERWRAIQLAELRNLFVCWAAANVALWTEVRVRALDGLFMRLYLSNFTVHMTRTGAARVGGVDRRCAVHRADVLGLGAGALLIAGRQRGQHFARAHTPRALHLRRPHVRRQSFLALTARR